MRTPPKIIDRSIFVFVENYLNCFTEPFRQTIRVAVNETHKRFKGLTFSSLVTLLRCMYTVHVTRSGEYRLYRQWLLHVTLTFWKLNARFVTAL